MEVTIGVASLKQFTKALACLVRYGDEITLNATPEFLRAFFERGYRVGKQEKRNSNGTEPVTGIENGRGASDDVEEAPQVAGVFTGKLLLSILRGSGAEKNAEKCHLMLVEGAQAMSEGDSIETRLLVKLQYKHGVFKTYTFTLSSADAIIVPAIPSTSSISTIQISGQTLKGLVDHFPKSEKRTSSEPLLIWQFYHNKTTLKTEDQWNASKGDWIGGKRKIARAVEEGDDDGSLIYSSLNSSLSLDESELDTYDIRHAPVTLALHMKEFSATMTLAEGLGAEISVRFTAHGQPVFFSIRSPMGMYNCFCALSTKVVAEGDNDGKRPPEEATPSMTISNQSVADKQAGRIETRVPVNQNGIEQRKRPRDLEEEFPPPSSKRRPLTGREKTIPLPFILQPDSETNTQEQSTPSFASIAMSTQHSGTNTHAYSSLQDPLFLPDSQTFQGSQVLREAGLGDLEGMTQAELNLFVDDDIELDIEDSGHPVTGSNFGIGGEEMQVDEAKTKYEEDWTSASQFPATQQKGSGGFTPLFDN